MTSDREESGVASMIQRIENAVLAVLIVLAMIAAGQPWWLLLATFLIFDISAVGYVRGARIGAVVYNTVHNFVGPCLLVIAYSAMHLADLEVAWLAVAGACWAFHVAVDRALGYGLKLETFSQTHLGSIGRARHDRGRRQDHVRR